MKIITICREYGAGGHSIGRKVAEQLGIEFYDRDIIKATAGTLGIDPEQLEQEEEMISRSESFLRSITPISYDRKAAIYDIQRDVILEIAKKGPCVILGRCADAVLEEAGIPSLDVFLYADDAHRAVRIGELEGLTSPSDIQRSMKKNDHDRRSYYTHYTGRFWGDRRNFNLMLDTGTLGYETSIRLICEAASACVD